MREEHFYSPASGDNHLAVFWYVRKYANGELELDVSVENGWVNVAGPTNKDYTPIVTIKGMIQTSVGAIRPAAPYALVAVLLDRHRPTDHAAA